MDVSIVTDEVSADLDTALELARSWNVTHVELRGVGDGRYPRVGRELRATTPRLIREYGVSVAAISSGLFKIPFPDRAAPLSFYQWSTSASLRALAAAEEALEDHLERLLPECADAAEELGCPIVTCFSFTPGIALHREMLGVSDDVPDGVIEVIREAGRRLAARGLVLALENEMTTWGASAATTAEIVRAVNEPNVGMTWDAANAYLAGDLPPFPDAYRRVADLVRLVHFKDVRTNATTGRREFCVDGEIDWVGQFAALQADGYTGAVSVETHIRPKVAPSRALVERLQGLLAALPGQA
ncbi:sugar phosphate isomerase/epimerase family protein [Actinomadura spongiicola]|nr:sugar phosphate isomerase/epimerase family protein [Actinomadura spongiicola]